MTVRVGSHVVSLEQMRALLMLAPDLPHEAVEYAFDLRV